MVKYIESKEEWDALMEESKSKLVVVDFTASWWVQSGGGENWLFSNSLGWHRKHPTWDDVLALIQSWSPRCPVARMNACFGAYQDRIIRPRSSRPRRSGVSNSLIAPCSINFVALCCLPCPRFPTLRRLWYILKWHAKAKSVSHET